MNLAVDFYSKHAAQLSSVFISFVLYNLCVIILKILCKNNKSPIFKIVQGSSFKNVFPT